MPNVTIRSADFRVVSRSKNLRGILAYSREHVVTRIDCFGPAPTEDRARPADRARCPDCGVPTVPDHEGLRADDTRCDACTVAHDLP